MCRGMPNQKNKCEMKCSFRAITREPKPTAHAQL